MNEWPKKKEFYEFIIKNDVIRFYEKPIRLRSGKESHYYVNWRRICCNARLADKLSDYIISYVNYKGLKPDTFVGVPEGATIIGLITQYKWACINGLDNYSLSLVRAKPKNHGDPADKYFVGAPKGRTLVIEDVTTTGESLTCAIEKLLENGVDIIGALSLTDRGAKINIVKHYAMSYADELLSLLRSKYF